MDVGVNFQLPMKYSIYIYSEWSQLQWEIC